MEIKGVIFDFDGTILDSMNIWDTLGSNYLISKNIKPNTNLGETIKTFSMDESAIYFQNEYLIQDSKQQIIFDINKIIQDFYFYNALLKNGVILLLKQFKNKNIKMCIATATDKHLVKAALKNNNIEQYFESVISCSDVGFGKDSPIIYEKAMQSLNTNKSNTIIFEDALHAIKTAKKAGFYVIGVHDNAAIDDIQEIQSFADIYIKSLDEWRIL